MCKTQRTASSPSRDTRYGLATALNVYWRAVNKRGNVEEMLKVAREALGILDGIHRELTTGLDSPGEEIEHVSTAGVSILPERGHEQALGQRNAFALRNFLNALHGNNQSSETYDTDERNNLHQRKTL